MMTAREIKEALRQGPWAWPGGYPCYFVACDGVALSFEAVRSNWRDVVAVAKMKDRRDGWALCGVEINWEDTELYCEHTGKRIEAAYQPDECEVD